MRRCHVERCCFGSRINDWGYLDRRLLSGEKRSNSGQCRCKTRSAGNLDGKYFARCDTASRSSKGPESGGADRPESPRGSSSFREELRCLPWFREGRCVGISDSERPLSKAAAIGDRWGRSEEHTSELQSRQYLVCRLLL